MNSEELKSTEEERQDDQLESVESLPISESKETVSSSAAKSDGTRTITRSKQTNAAHIIPAESVEAEEIPTVPLDSLLTLHTLQPEVNVHSVASTQAVSVPTPLVAHPSEYRRSTGEWIQVWLDGMRPRYLWLAVLPILLGTAFAWIQTLTPKNPFGSFHLTHLLGSLLATVLLQFGANLVNDYHDYVRGIDTGNSLGPGGLIQQGYIKPTRVLYTGLTCLGLGTVVGLIVVIGHGSLVLLFGLLVALSAYFYSATSRALSSIALGEVVGFTVFGPLLTIGSYIVQRGEHFPSTLFLYSIPSGLLAAAIIHTNNMRDIEGDAQAHKTTLATLLGLPLSRVLYVVLMLAAYVIVILRGVPKGAPHQVLLVLWTLPMLVVALSGIVRSGAPAGFDLIVRQTLKLAVWFTLFLIAGLIIASIIPVLPHLPAKLLPF